MKTLKDLNICNSLECFIKQEAIKWVNEKRTVNNDMEDFMKFHNITEEDLK